MCSHIQVDHVTYVLPRLIDEVNDNLQRLWFIIKQRPQNDVEFNYAEYLSRYWYYMTFYECNYPATIEKRVKDVEKYLYID